MQYSFNIEPMPKPTRIRNGEANKQSNKSIKFGKRSKRKPNKWKEIG